MNYNNALSQMIELNLARPQFRLLLDIIDLCNQMKPHLFQVYFL